MIQCMMYTDMLDTCDCGATSFPRSWSSFYCFCRAIVRLFVCKLCTAMHGLHPNTPIFSLIWTGILTRIVLTVAYRLLEAVCIIEFASSINKPGAGLAVGLFHASKTPLFILPAPFKVKWTAALKLVATVELLQ